MSYKTLKIGMIRTSRTELIDITKAWIALSLAFAFVYSGISLLRGNLSNLLSLQFIMMLGISAVTAGIGFLFHELAHKFVAQHYGCEAEFRAWDQFLYFAVGLAVLAGFIFAAPGAVMIAGQITRKENGLVSLAGPLTNYLLALVFFGLIIVWPSLSFMFTTGMFINLWLGLFNMIPFGNFDGRKVFQWNTAVWGMMVAIGVIALFF